MIRPDEEKSGMREALPRIENEPGTKDYWAYIQDYRLRHPKLWRVLIRVHTRAFRLAYPEYALNDIWKLGDVILRDASAAIEDTDPKGPHGSDCFKLQMPVFPAESQASGFEGRWRGWLSIGKPELVY